MFSGGASNRLSSLRIVLIGPKQQRRVVHRDLPNVQVTNTGGELTRVLLQLTQPHGLILCTNAVDKVEEVRRRAGWKLFLVVIPFGEANVASLLNAGADDCINLERCTPAELEARLYRFVRNTMKSEPFAPPDEHLGLISQDGYLHFSPYENVAYVDKKPVRLTKREGALLAILMEQDMVHSSDSLQSLLWSDTTPHIDGLRILVMQLRRKLNDVSKEPRFIETVLGVGYRFRQSVRHGLLQRPHAPS